jgi:hypothetical protein
VEDRELAIWHDNTGIKSPKFALRRNKIPKLGANQLRSGLVSAVNTPFRELQLRRIDEGNAIDIQRKRPNWRKHKFPPGGISPHIPHKSYMLWFAPKVRPVT